MNRESRFALSALALACVIAPLEAGCGGAAMRPADSYDIEPERERPSELAAEQREAEDELSAVLARREPDCARACELGDAICELEGRICGIAERHPEDSQTAGLCEDARARCASARSRVAPRCGCDAP